MHDIFLSYASEDLPRVLPLVRALERQGWSVWWDRKIPPGKTYDRVIEEALDAARCVVVAWSRTSVASDWVKAEADEGKRRDILIPVMLEDARIPLGFRQIQAARLLDWQDSEEPHEEFDNVVRAVTHLLGPPPLKESAVPVTDEPVKPPPDLTPTEYKEPFVPEPRPNEKVETFPKKDSQQIPDQQEIRETKVRKAITLLRGKKRLLWTTVVTLFLLVPILYIATRTKDKEIAPIASIDKIATPTEDKEATRTSSIGMEFVLIPAGEFRMGSEDGDPDERPVHQVTISQPFYLGKYEVTQAQWKAVMGNNPSSFTGDNRPVESVSWEDVQTFIRKLNEREGGTKYRLPTEAEWEYAARAGSTTAYSFGDDPSQLGEYAWYEANSGDETHPVGQLKPNVWDLYDMHGNVWEWVQDWYGEYPQGSVTDPTGPSSGSNRVYRGGSWDSYARYCRSADRSYWLPDSCDPYLGFRLLRTVS